MTDTTSSLPKDTPPATEEVPKMDDAGENATSRDEPQTRDPSPIKESADYITGWRLQAVVCSVTLVVFLLLLDQAVISTAIPQITSDLKVLSDVGWYAGAYVLASAALQPLTGKIYKSFRAKWTFLAFLFIFEIGSLVCGVAQTSAVLIGGRAIAGAGSSGLVNGGMTVIAGSVPLGKRPLYTGIMLGIGQLGLIMGPLIGGALTQYTTWRWCFYINLPLGGTAAFFLVLIHVPDVTVKDKFNMTLIRKALPDLDLIGFSLFAPAIIMLLLALQLGSDIKYAWNSSVIIGLFVGAGATTIVFAFWEAHVGDKAMIPGSLIKQRIIWASCVQIFCLMCCVFVANYYLPIYFQAVKGVGPTMSGVYMLPGILSQLLFIIGSGVAVSKLGYYVPWSVGGAILVAIGNGLVSTFSPGTSTGKWVGYQILQGAGRGAAMQVSIIAAQNAVSPDQTPVVLAILIFSQNLGGAMSIVIATTIFTQSLLSDLKKLAPSVSGKAVLAAGGGAGAVRSLVPPGSPELQGILKSYSNAFDKVFYMLAGFAVVVFFVSFLMGWKDVRVKKDKVVEEEQVQEKVGDV